MIRTRRDGPVAIVAIDRPEARNALSADGWDALAAAMESLSGSDAAAVILTSDVPGIFCAGADLAMLAALIDDADARPAFRTRMTRAIDAIVAVPVPVIAAVDGGCYGAGVALTLTCDFCVAGEGAVFAVTPAKLGIGYPGADVARLTDRVGRASAARLLFTAAPIDADEAYRIGLAQVRAEDARVSACDLARTIAGNDRDAIRLLKRTIGRPSDAGFDAAFGGDGFAERLAAFRARPR